MADWAAATTTAMFVFNVAMIHETTTGKVGMEKMSLSVCTWLGTSMGPSDPLVLILLSLDTLQAVITFW